MADTGIPHAARPAQARHRDVPALARRNLVLAGLPATEFDRLTDRVRPVSLPAGRVLAEAGVSLPVVLLPVSGVCSVVAVMADGSAVETATIGNEGTVAPGPAALGGPGMRLVWQVPGDALRMTLADYRAELERHGTFAERVGLAYQALTIQVMQSVACNRLHSVEQRMARWLLMTRDRVGGADFQLTHEFLGIMLGTSRPNVTVIARGLSARGLIAYRRGRMRIVDRDGLEAASCECYRLVRDEIQSLLGPAG